jgi:hypothetical protein
MARRPACKFTCLSEQDFANARALRANSDDGPGEWMPPDKRYRCRYDERSATIPATTTST